MYNSHNPAESTTPARSCPEAGSARKKICICSEGAYILAILLISLAGAMIAATDLGLSMLGAPAYILSQKLSFLTYGQSEYIIQGVLFVIFCIAMGEFKLMYAVSFAAGVLYGSALDLWRLIIPHFNPAVTAPGSLPLPLTILYFVLGMLLSGLAVSLFFHSYLYPQVYELFVKGLSAKYSIDSAKFKLCFDLTFLLIAVLLSLSLFGSLVGIGIGTIIQACMNGLLIGFFNRLLDKYFILVPKLKNISSKFTI